MAFDPDLFAFVCRGTQPVHVFLQYGGVPIPDGIFVEIEINVFHRGYNRDFNLLFRCNLSRFGGGRRCLTFHVLPETSTTTKGNTYESNK